MMPTVLTRSISEHNEFRQDEQDMHANHMCQ